MTIRIAAIVVIETDDGRLTGATRSGVAGLRDAVIAGLPGLSRVIGIMSEPEARLMLGAHVTAMRAAGVTPDEFAAAAADFATAEKAAFAPSPAPARRRGQRLH